ncbi:unnamed protein product [Caenorhabditis sp. 36 PRJEB53466]|nr:unnamed protein product [Caenorhabditis sp. 36 PRJEB53466]
MSDEASKYFFEERSDSTNHTPINESASRFSQTVFLELYKKAGINGEPLSGSSVPSVRDSAVPIRYPTPQPLPDLSALARFVSGAPQSPVPRPRTITPVASFASLSSTSSDTPQPNSIRRVGNIADASNFKTKRVFLLAARRLRNADGSFALILVEPKSGKRFIENEKVYNEVHRLSLGDFFTAQTDGKSLSVHRKIKNHGGGLKTSVQGDLVHVENVQATLVNRNGVLAFRSKYFDEAHCNEKMPEGEYIIKLFALEPPQTTPSKKFFFQGYNARQVSPDGVAQQPVQGAGFTKKEVQPLVPLLQNLTIGAGFASQKPTEQKGEAMIGAGFEDGSKKLDKLRAVVLNREDRDDFHIHYLWLVDKHEEAKFNYKLPLEKGHFFEGFFRPKEENKKRICQKYGRPERCLAPGGLDNKKNIFFKVSIENFQAPGGNRRFGQTHSPFFGSVIDKYSKLSADCNGGEMKIQRLPIESKIGEATHVEYVWVIVEVL